MSAFYIFAILHWQHIQLSCTLNIMLEKIDTFEDDIANEVKQKEASVVSISAAGGDVGNTPLPTPPNTSSLLIWSIVFVITIIVLTLGGYIYYIKTKTIVIPPIEQVSKPPVVNLERISPELNNSIGQFVTNTNKNEYGYIISINSYSPVFSYMIKNENLYADEIANSVGSGRDTSTTSEPFIFTDVTQSNQNMRVGTSGSSTVIYAFIGNDSIVIASSTEGILSLRNRVLTP